MRKEVKNMDLEKLYTEYFTTVYRFTLSISKNPDIAEEITQETFFRALKAVDSFKGKSSLKVWLCQIAKNLYYTYMNKQKRCLPIDAEHFSRDGTHSSEKIFFQKTAVKQIHRVIHNMNEPHKEVFSLRFFGELSFSEIGELFNKTEGWARVTYHRAKLKIKEELKNEDNM